MRFHRSADPHQLAMLTSTLDEFCCAQNIDPFTPDHEHAAMLVMALFNRGANSEGALATALTEWARRQATRALPVGGRA